MASNNLLCVITIGLFILCTNVFVTNGRTMLGGRTKVENVEKNKEVQEIGKYSVEEYNRLKRSGSGSNESDLTFLRVVEAEKQVVAGMKYYMRIEGVEENDGGLKEFEAVVVVKPWLKSKQLVKFSPSSSVPVW
uniref:cysteine proteinase inhibitor B-like n=1 Tax=Erigeron canadensis TaxID=72917 RepID=UPI001CB8C8DB|nr:cysteine proteinase inhibitor B-like [Erigeron canadensis]